MEKILVVDDEPGILELCRKVLVREKYIVFLVSSGEEALKLIPEGMFDLVLTDLKLGELSGLDIITNIKSLYPNTEVLVMTGQATIETAIECLKRGAYDYITKPFNIYELVDSVKKALDHAQLKRKENISREIIYFYKHSQEVTKQLTEENLANLVLESAIKGLKCDSGSIFVFKRDENKLFPLAIVGPVADKGIDDGGKILSWVAEKKEPLLIQNGLDNLPQFKDLPKRKEIVSSMVVPLIDQGMILGVLSLNRFVQGTKYQFNSHDLESLQTFAFHATMMLSATRHNQALRELDKLKSEFVAKVSHELRTPLMAISGAVELLQSYMSGSTSKKTDDIMELMARNTVRMNYLINEVLNFSTMEAKQSKLSLLKFSLRKLMDETVSDFAFKAKEKGISLGFENIDKTEEIMMTADREKVKQILSNLLANAVTFTPKKGWVRLGYRLENKDSVLITVADSGIGIPEDKQKNIFDQFYQVDGSMSREYPGFGLGLSIVRSSVLAHNGKIWVESMPGKGAKFFVVLPLKTVEEKKI
ncbi:MAG: response regulator [Elusimicrobia bacterium]|nr:response regulator [Candidatus Liberimonas magnetica]